MDPSLSVNNDPHHPPQFTSFTNSNPFSAQNHPFYTGVHAVAPANNNHLYPAPQQHQTSPVPSIAHPPYADMICAAISALNEADGSSKQAISRYIERVYTGIPTAHSALLTHHLKTLKNNGILMMVKKSYKFAAPSLLEPPRSNFTVNDNQPLLDQTMAPSTQKRGRGRPPKPKPETNGNPTCEQTELPVSRPEEIQIQIQPEPPIKRPPGRPRKDGALPKVKEASVVSSGMDTVKRRGRPPSGRAAGRERKPTVVSAPASVFPYVANGSGVRRRGRPKKVDAAASLPPPPLPQEEEEEVAVKKRGRGRPPKVGNVIRKPMKPLRSFPRIGRPLGRPRKNPVSMGPSRREDGDYGELQKKFELFQARAKDILIVLKSEIRGSENQVVVQAIHDLEALTTMDTHLEIEELSKKEHSKPDGDGQGQTQTEAEAMQEALF